MPLFEFKRPYQALDVCIFSCKDDQTLCLCFCVSGHILTLLEFKFFVHKCSWGIFRLGLYHLYIFGFLDTSILVRSTCCILRKIDRSNPCTAFIEKFMLLRSLVFLLFNGTFPTSFRSFSLFCPSGLFLYIPFSQRLKWESSRHCVYPNTRSTRHKVAATNSFTLQYVFVHRIVSTDCWNPLLTPQCGQLFYLFTLIFNNGRYTEHSNTFCRIAFASTTDYNTQNHLRFSSHASLSASFVYIWGTATWRMVTHWQLQVMWVKTKDRLEAGALMVGRYPILSLHTARSFRVEILNPVQPLSLLFTVECRQVSSHNKFFFQAFCIEVLTHLLFTNSLRLRHFPW